MTPLQASATVINLVLATGPFTYPQGFVQLGPVLSSILMVVTCVIAYMTATFMVEAISVANANDKKRRTFSMFGMEQYKSPIIARNQNMADMNNKQSPYYIRQKIEIGIITERLAGDGWRTFFIIIMTVYMYGAICLKYVSGAESFVAGVSYTFWKNDDGFKEWLGFDPYYFGLLIFGFFSLYFSFGNIENAKTLQIVTTALRFIVTIMMCSGSIYYMAESGSHPSPVFEWSKQIKHLAQVFGNTTFVFIYHHSVSGIIYPVRPQKHVKQMFLWSNIIGGIFLLTEALLAYFAFGSLDNFCTKPKDFKGEFIQKFPCKVSGLYNQNFLDLPGIG